MSRWVFVLISLTFFASPLSAAEQIQVGEHKVASQHHPKAISWEKDLNAGRKRMVESGRPMMLFLTAPGCHYCDKMKADTFAQQWITKEIMKRYTPVMINGREHRDVANRLNVRMFPTIAIVHPTGKIVEIAYGYKSAPAFLQHMAVAEARLKMESEKLATNVKASSTTVVK